MQRVLEMDWDKLLLGHGRPIVVMVDAKAALKTAFADWGMILEESGCLA